MTLRGAAAVVRRRRGRDDQARQAQQGDHQVGSHLQQVDLPFWRYRPVRYARRYVLYEGTSLAVVEALYHAFIPSARCKHTRIHPLFGRVSDPRVACLCTL